MTSRKMMWNTLDELEGKKRGSSYFNLQKEKERQGYKRVALQRASLSKLRQEVADEYPDMSLKDVDSLSKTECIDMLKDKGVKVI